LNYQHSLVWLVRAFLTLPHHWTHWTYKYLSFDSGIRWDARAAGDQEKQDEYYSLHDLSMGIRKKS
jgi:hypothetical protein